MGKVENDSVLLELLDRFKPSGQNRALDRTVGEHTGRGERLLGHLHPHQLHFAKDPSKRKAARCSRRAGKTVALAALMGQFAENYPGGLIIYITTTKKAAKRLAWPELRRLHRTYSLGWRFNDTEAFITTPGGSVIVLAGADKTDDIEKFRGLAPNLVVLDESASFKAHINRLIEEVLEPALMDYDAPLILAGTPGRIPKGLFWEATAGNSREWATHHWTMLDNPLNPRWAGRDNWRQLAQNELWKVLRRKGWTIDTPRFRREYLGLWCKDESEMLYRYDAGAVLVDELPPGEDWQFVMGIDLGETGTAFFVWAYSPDVTNVYGVWAEKHRHLRLEDVARIGKPLEKLFSPMKMKVIDTGGLGQTFARHLKERHDFVCIPAEKRQKTAFIELLNDDLGAGHVFLLRDTTNTLRAEWDILERDADGDEAARQDNHTSDAALYAWRYCRHYKGGKARQPRPGEKGYERHLEEQMWDYLAGPQDEEESLWWGETGGAQERQRDLAVSERLSESWGDLG